MKEKPTIFQLAQLAAQSVKGALPRDAVKRAMALWNEAEAELAEHDNRREYLRGLFWTPNGKRIPIFSDSPEAWSARLKGYPGHERDVNKALWDQEFENEFVQKQLFKDKSLSRDTRQTLFLGLVRASILFDMPGPPVPCKDKPEYLGSSMFIDPRPGFPIHPANVELAETNYSGYGKMKIPSKEVAYVDGVTKMLLAPKLNGYLVRWAAEVRLRQVALAKSRVIPESVRHRHCEDGAEQNIQFKRSYRQ